MYKFIAFEGLDGSGKSTQISLLQRYFEQKGIKCKFLHFPRLNSPVIGMLVSRFLRGELGTVDNVDPYLVALMYATDRAHSKDMINSWLDSDYTVIVDRYLYSNVAFQCAKVDDIEQKKELKKWILDLEININNVPMPDVSLLLSVPFDFIVEKLGEERNGTERKYLNNMEDIHERSLFLQQRVAVEYLRLSQEHQDIKEIKCSDSLSCILSPSKIHEQILNNIRMSAC